ncbi:Lsr2 family protein [Kocuria sp. CPCC 205268]|uniref:histone-like nucleoid-structuring protein Lsr2 n=1 Tax=Kocuria oxytropis TaxID=3058913 RepID=UPI0034D68C19
MAQKVEVHLEDDLDGGPAEHTVTITLDSKNYEIDLSDPNAETLRPYAAAGRKASRATGARGSGTRSLSADPDPAKIRIWAKDHGHPVSDRGRISQSVRDTYYAAH